MAAIPAKRPHGGCQITLLEHIVLSTVVCHHLKADPDEELARAQADRSRVSIPGQRDPT